MRRSPYLCIRRSIASSHCLSGQTSSAACSECDVTRGVPTPHLAIQRSGRGQIRERGARPRLRPCFSGFLHETKEQTR
jgi:hypothetical protein